jgi:hypothetical protein
MRHCAWCYGDHDSWQCDGSQPRTREEQDEGYPTVKYAIQIIPGWLAAGLVRTGRPRIADCASTSFPA